VFAIKNYNFKLIIIISLIFFILLTSIYYYKTKESAISNASNKIDQLLLNYKAVRMNVSNNQKQEIYRLQNLNIIDSDYFNPSLLSSTYNAKQVNNFYNQFRKLNNKKPIIIKFASDNPRNPNNKATKKESQILKRFNDNEIKHYNEIIEKDGKLILYNAIPTRRTTQKCMRCHSTPDIAPKDLVKIYGDKNGFHEQSGEIRAILTTSYPLDDEMTEAFKNFIILTIITAMFFIILLTILYIFMRNVKLSNKKLDEKVYLRTKELEEDKEYINTIIESNNNAIIAINIKGIITVYNKKAQDMFGWTKDEMIGKSNILNIIPPKYQDKHSKALSLFFKTGKLKGILDKEIQLEAQRKNKEIFPIRISIGTKFNYLKTVVVANISDITLEKKQEFILDQQSKLVSMGEMIANIAHQWRQPLSVISTTATGMQMEKEYDMLTDEKFNEYCSTINVNTQYLSQTIEDFRNFIKDDMRLTKFNLKENIEQFLHIINSTIKKEDIEIILDMDNDIELNGYPNELIQCLINIINNAKDALNEHNVNHKYIFISTKKEKENIIIRIKDNGGGIKEDILARVFEPYFTTKHQSQGTGLGLNMTYNLITTGMKGKITVLNKVYNMDDNKYTGAEFKITLPIDVINK